MNYTKFENEHYNLHVIQTNRQREMFYVMLY